MPMNPSIRLEMHRKIEKDPFVGAKNSKGRVMGNKIQGIVPLAQLRDLARYFPPTEASSGLSLSLEKELIMHTFRKHPKRALFPLESYLFYTIFRLASRSNTYTRSRERDPTTFVRAGLHCPAWRNNKILPEFYSDLPGMIDRSPASYSFLGGADNVFPVVYREFLLSG